MKNTKKKGFTIVELVIVIAVIGILSAVLIPTFSNLVTKAKKSAFQQGLNNAYTEYATCVADDKLEEKDKLYFEVKSEDVIPGVAKAGYYKFDVEKNEFVFVSADAPAVTEPDVFEKVTYSDATAYTSHYVVWHVVVKGA